MSRHRHRPVSDAQTRYAHLRALIDIRLAELGAALDRHEAHRGNWQHPDTLEAVDRKLIEALSTFEGRAGCENEMQRPTQRELRLGKTVR